MKRFFMIHFVLGVWLFAWAGCDSGDKMPGNSVGTDADADTDTDVDADTDTDVDADTDTDVNADTDTDVNADTDTDVNADTDTDADTDVDTDADTDVDTDADTDVDTETDIVFQELRADLERETNPDATSEDLGSMRNGNVSLGFDLFHALAAKGDCNFALSPVSIRSAFGMLQAAAKGQTETEIAQAMGFLADKDRMHGAMNAHDLALRSRNLPEEGTLGPVVLETANSVFISQDRAVEDTYLQTIAVNYGAGVHLADFYGDPDGERVKINRWVEQQTHNRIEDLLPGDSVDKETLLVLVNALYVMAPWKMEFDKNATRDQLFTRMDGTDVKVPFMRDAMRYLSCSQGEDYKMVDLPLRGADLTVTLILPDKGKYVEFESGLTTQRLDTMLAGMKKATVELALPKFEIDTGSVDLKPILLDLGMVTPFCNSADFSGFGPDLCSARVFFVFHSVFMTANEAGMEAGAATAVGVAPGIPHVDFQFDANRPFVFLIRDIPTGLVLFIGRVMDPTA